MAKEYEQQGLYKKALRAYKTLLRRGKTNKVHEAYFKLLLRLRMYETAEKYLKLRLKKREDLRLRVDMLYLWKEMDAQQKLRKELLRLIQQVKRNTYKLNSLANYLSKYRMYKEALQAYQEGRKVAKASDTYTLTIAQLHFALGQRRAAINEYLNHLRLRPNYLSYIQELMNSFYTEESDEQILRELLLTYRQRYPDVRSLLDLSVWFLTNLGAYEEAFTEAVAADRRSPLGARYFVDMGKRALTEEAYAAAVDIFSYVVKTYARSMEVRRARYEILYAKEQLYLNTLPTTEELQKLVQDYKRFISEEKKDVYKIYAELRLSDLYARWLQVADSAVLLLQTVIETARSHAQLYAKVKISLGDAYLLAGRPWEATLQYAQVEKETKDVDLRERAQFRRAKMSYYQGAFALAKEQLSILRQASSKYTANDALLLYSLIGLYAGSEGDTSAWRPLWQLARAELAVESNRLRRAEETLQLLLQQELVYDMGCYVRYLLADLQRRRGAFSAAVALLREGLAGPSPSFLEDKLLLLEGEILEEDLQDLFSARRVYQSFIVKAPQSIYLPEVRRRLQCLQKVSARVP